MSGRADFDRDDRPSTAQPPPIPRSTVSMHDLVIADVWERKAFGLRKYGTTLTAHNGRNPLVDAYEEVLDLAVYLKQAILEQQAADRGQAPR